VGQLLFLLEEDPTLAVIDVVVVIIAHFNVGQYGLLDHDLPCCVAQLLVTDHILVLFLLPTVFHVFAALGNRATVSVLITIGRVRSFTSVQSGHCPHVIQHSMARGRALPPWIPDLHMRLRATRFEWHDVFFWGFRRRASRKHRWLPNN
jgi:hypothetical protein